MNRPPRAISRGSALAATAALLAGCANLRALRASAMSCIDVPRAKTPVGAVVEGRFAARGTAATVGYAIALPAGVDPRSIEGVVYLLPGRGGSARAVDEFSGFAADVMAAGTRPFAIIGIDSGESYYHPRTSGEDRLAIVEHDLPALARQHFPRLAYESIVGQSMGGYGALLAAERTPGRYRAVGVAGPAIFQSYAEENHAIGDGFDNARQFARYDVIAHASRLANLPLIMRAGYDDPFLTNIKAFAKHVRHADVRYVEHGCHDDGFWRASAREIFTFVTKPHRRLAALL
jgi:S-formylglutathione hydrolase FrmB